MVAGLAGCSQSEGGDAGDGSSDGASTDTTSSADTVKIGVLEDQSGNFALVGDPKYKASMLAIEGDQRRRRHRRQADRTGHRRPPVR